MNARHLADLASYGAERRLICLKVVRAGGAGIKRTNGVLCEHYVNRVAW